eukprot:SAG31_NODE_1759_length_7328_cov_3.146770_4_plen_445_part_00
MVALQNAESLGSAFVTDNDLVAAAQAALQDVVLSMDVLDSLSAAVDKKSRSMLEKALAKADAATMQFNYVVKSKIADARELLETLVEREQAERELEAAMRTGNSSNIDKAMQQARAAGVDESLLASQQATADEAASTAKAATRQGKTEFLDSVAELPYIDRMQEMEDVFGKLTGYDRVRSKEMSVTYTKIPIKRPMTKFIGPESSALEKKAVTLFLSVLGYMGERKIEYPEMLASELLQEGIDTEEMRDEIYLQIMKQCTRNETPSLLRGWQLLMFCLRTFPPSIDLAPYTEVYLYKAAKGDGIRSDVRQQVVSMAQTAVRRLFTRMREGPREHAITKEEIEAARSEQPVQATVYFADHSVKKFEIDEEMTVIQLKETIAVALKIPVVDTYSLYDVSNVADPYCLEVDAKIFDLLREWERPPDAKESQSGGGNRLRRLGNRLKR